MKNAFRGLTTSVAMGMSVAVPVQAQDSLHASMAASAASMAVVSVLPASVVVVSAHVGAAMIVESVRFVGNVAEVVFKGAANAGRAVITVSAASVRAMGIVVGQTVKVAAEGGGYLLIAAGKVLCYIPAAADQGLVRSARSH